MLDVKSMRLPALISYAAESDEKRVVVGLELLRRAERKLAKRAAKEVA